MTQVLVCVVDDKEFFVVDEDTTAEEIVAALKTMRNGRILLYDLFMIQLTERIPQQRTEVDYSLQSP